MITIVVNEESSTTEDMALVLERIVCLIRQGNTSGYDPDWELSGDEEPEENE